MKLKRLELKAFGPFTGRSIAFNSDEPGLHIIFGPNEAGKSSALRALKALLYGFDQQTPDNFLHNYDQLLVGGALENSAGDEIVFQRRKKRVNDIMDASGNALDAGVLAPFLHGVEPGLFESLYGIDHEALVRGGKDILDQKGEVGQALFAAGAGISSLRQIIDQLETEAADLFKPAGQLPQINKAVKRFKALQKELKAATLSIKKWKEHQKVLKNAEADLERLEKERDQNNKALQRLNRLHRAIPELAALTSRKQQLQALGDVVILSPDFSERERIVHREMHDARQHLDMCVERRKKLEAKRNAISINRELLDHGEPVDDFHQLLGEYNKGRKDRPERNGMRISLRREAANLLKQVRPDLTLEHVEVLRPVLSRKRTLQALIPRHEAIRQQLTSARKQGKAAERDLKDTRQALAAMPAVKEAQGLRRAVKLARKAGDIDAQLEKNRRDVEQGKAGCRSELKRIGLWSGELPALIELALPLSHTVQQFDHRFRQMADQRREVEKERNTIEKELTIAHHDMKKVAYTGSVPSEEELIRTREKREQGWQLLRRQWLDQEDVTEQSRRYAPGHPLHEAYEAHVGQADLIADRLRREADRVVTAAALRARIESLQGALEKIDNDSEALDLRVKQLDQEWSEVWQSSGITPLSPKEMDGWLAEMDKLRFKIDDMVKKEQGIEPAAERRKELRQTLQNELTAMGAEKVPAGETLDPVLILAETTLERMEARKTEYEKLKARRIESEKVLHQAREDLGAAQERLSDWQAQWRKAISGLGVDDEISPVEAIDIIETLQRCFDTLKEADDLQKRIDGIDRDAADLETQVKALVATVASDLPAAPLDQTLRQLRTRLGQAQKNSALYNDLSEEIDNLQQEISVARKALHSAKEQMDELLRIAGCEKPDQLAAVIDRFGEYQRLQESISDTEAALAKIGAGVPVDELSRQAAQVDADALPVQIESLQRDIDERIYPEIKRMSQIIGEENNKLAAMDGNAKAAASAQEMEQALATIRRLAERYALLKLSTRILQQEIERYRETHQDPVLKIASRYFSDLTVGSFSGLHTDVDDKSRPILVGVRPDHSRLTVEKMSAGTCDQLFLALRLATLEWRLETSEPIPFIVDDILINFDDERSRATLKVLADLSKKNQVILFTHHRQIVEETHGIEGGGVIQIHELQGGQQSQAGDRATAVFSEP